MARLALVLFALIAQLVVTGSSQALSLVEVARTNRITAMEYDPQFGGYMPRDYSESGPAGFGSWSSELSGGQGNLVRAQQDSLVSEAQLRAYGDVGMWTSGEYAETMYHVVFDLAEATTYSFFVDNLDTNACCNWAPTGSVTFTGPGVSYSVELGRNASPGSGGQGHPDFFASGILGPGTYTLDYLLRINGSHNAAGSGLSGVDLVLAPEPSTALLLALGVTGLALRRRHG